MPTKPKKKIAKLFGSKVIGAKVARTADGGEIRLSLTLKEKVLLDKALAMAREKFGHDKTDGALLSLIMTDLVQAKGGIEKLAEGYKAHLEGKTKS